MHSGPLVCRCTASNRLAVAACYQYKSISTFLLFLAFPVLTFALLAERLAWPLGGRHRLNECLPPVSTVTSDASLLRVPFAQLRRNGSQVTKQASGAMIRSGGEVHLCRRRGCGIVISRTDISRAQGPDAIDGQRLSTCILEQSVKFPGSQVIGGDEAAGLGISATGELPDEKVVAEASEIKRSQSYTPRSVQPITIFEAP